MPDLADTSCPPAFRADKIPCKLQGRAGFIALLQAASAQCGPELFGQSLGVPWHRATSWARSCPSPALPKFAKL